MVSPGYIPKQQQQKIIKNNTTFWHWIIILYEYVLFPQKVENVNTVRETHWKIAVIKYEIVMIASQNERDEIITQSMKEKKWSHESDIFELLSNYYDSSHFTWLSSLKTFSNNFRIKWRFDIKVVL